MVRNAAKLLGIYMCLFACLPLSSPVIAAESDENREYRIKAAYIYNLIKFINWPQSETNNPTNRRSTKICIYGPNPFSGYLDRLSERKAKGLPIEVSSVNRRADLQSCHVVFLSKQADNITSVLSEFKNKPYLTVGETNDFVQEDGGIIGLIVNDNKVQLVINLAQAKLNKFEISGNLLEVAKIIK